MGVGVGSGSHAFLESNVIQNNGASGSVVSDFSQMFSSNDVFQGNPAEGVDVRAAYFSASNSSFLNNTIGVRAGASTVGLVGGTITGSGEDGMILRGNSTAAFLGPTITGNGGFRRGQHNGEPEWYGRRLRSPISDYSFCRKDRWYHKLRRVSHSCTVRNHALRFAITKAPIGPPDVWRPHFVKSIRTRFANGLAS